MKTPKASPDPMALGSPDPLEGGFGDEALEAHMSAFARANKAGDARGMATAFRAAVREAMLEEEPAEMM